MLFDGWCQGCLTNVKFYPTAPVQLIETLGKPFFGWRMRHTFCSGKYSRMDSHSAACQGLTAVLLLLAHPCLGKCIVNKTIYSICHGVSSVVHTFNV